MNLSSPIKKRGFAAVRRWTPRETSRSPSLRIPPPLRQVLRRIPWSCDRVEKTPFWLLALVLVSTVFSLPMLISHPCSAVRFLVIAHWARVDIDWCIALHSIANHCTALHRIAHLETADWNCTHQVLALAEFDAQLLWQPVEKRIPILQPSCLKHKKELFFFLWETWQLRYLWKYNF